MKLYCSPPSAFSRKVRLAAHALGIAGQIELVMLNPVAEVATLRRVNPLGKIPVLITDEGESLYDSPVICRFLDHTFGPGVVVPADPAECWTAGKLEALSDGMTEAGMLYRQMLGQPDERQDAGAIAHQLGKLTTGLDYLETIVGDFGDKWTLAQIAFACTLGWLQFRLADKAFLVERPKCRDWFEQVSSRTDMMLTDPGKV